MALDFHNRENKEHLFALTDDQCNALQEILEELTRWTGQTIDQYGDSYMDKNIQMTLLRLIDKYVQTKNLNEEKPLNNMQFAIALLKYSFPNSKFGDIKAALQLSGRSHHR